MATRLLALGSLLPLCFWSTGCAGVGRVNLSQRTGGNAALFGQFQACDGHTGRPISFAEVVRRCAQADVVLFGEQHSDAVCNQLEAQLFHALTTRRRPVALAMEFLEADTQAALDAYLAGRIDEAAYRQQARQGRAYVLSHRPLLEMCRTGRVPVLAANAPRRLVRAYRKSGLDYDDYRDELDPEDQRWLPTESEYLTGPYQERFFQVMGSHGPGARPKTTPDTQPASRPASRPTTMLATAPASRPAGEMGSASSVERFFRSQLLWDDAMAEALANFRARYAAHRVMLIVGVFHVAHEGGTAVKFRQRRPRDRVITIAYRSTTDGAFPFDEDDRHAGDIVVYGIIPPAVKSGGPPKRPVMPATTRPTTTAPADTQPTATAPTATQPTSKPAPAGA